ncbi:MAG: tetratricopeptide repeat protein [Acidobacteriaceae bacterium]
MLKKTWLAALLIMATAGWAQNATNTASTAKIHGNAQDPLNIPIANAKVLLSPGGGTIKYTFTTDANGDFKGEDIAPGTYTIVLQKAPENNGKKAAAPSTTPGAIPNVIDSQQSVKLTAGEDTQVNFDLSRKEYVDKLPPEQRKLLEETRKKNAEVNKENAQIKNLNSLITQARAARKAGNYDQAITLDQQATQLKPTEGLLWYELGDSYLGAKKYDDAVTNYKKALDILQAAAKPKPEIIASADNNMGEAYAKSGKNDLAVAAYDAAAKVDPTHTAMYYGNEAVVLYKAGQADAAGAAAEKAIAADPTKPVPYYIKGWSLVQKSTVDPKTQRIVLPPGCADAYQKFLELAPNGPLADDARSILASAGETIHSSYKKGKH